MQCDRCRAGLRPCHATVNACGTWCPLCAESAQAEVFNAYLEGRDVEWNCADCGKRLLNFHPFEDGDPLCAGCRSGRKHAADEDPDPSPLLVDGVRRCYWCDAEAEFTFTYAGTYHQGCERHAARYSAGRPERIVQPCLTLPDTAG